MKRSTFITTAVLTGLSGIANGMPDESTTLLHHVFFWLKNPESTADRAALIAGLKTLAPIPGIRQMHIGVPASTEKREVVDNSWDVSELMFFNDEAAQKIYQDHQVHQAFVKNYSHLWAKVIVYDAVDI